MVGQKRPRIGGPTRRPTPSAYLRPSYPLAGCSPAEPTSVSPGEQSIAEQRPRSKINQELPVRKAGKSVAKEWPFFVQRMGSTSLVAFFQQAFPRINNVGQHSLT